MLGVSNWGVNVCVSRWDDVGRCGVAERRCAENSGDGSGVNVVELGIEYGMVEFAGKNWLAVGSGPSYRSGGFENPRPCGGGVCAIVGEAFSAKRTSRQVARTLHPNWWKVGGFTVAVSSWLGLAHQS